MKFRFNFIDALIILVIAGAVAFAVYRAPRGAQKEQVAVFYKIQLAEQENKLHELINEGDTVFISLKEKDAGIVRAVSAEPAVIMAYDAENGVYKNIEAPGKWDITLMLESVGVETEGGITAGQTPIRVGEEIYARGRGYTGRGFIIWVETKEG